MYINRDYVFLIEQDKEIINNMKMMYKMYRCLASFTDSFYREKKRILKKEEIKYVFEMYEKKYKKIDELQKNKVIEDFEKDYRKKIIEKDYEFNKMYYKPKNFLTFEKNDFEIKGGKIILKNKELKLKEPLDIINDKKVNKISLTEKEEKIFITLHTSRYIDGISIINRKNKEDLKIIGIDLGLKELATLSNGKKYENPRFYQQNEEKIKKIQKELSTMQKGSIRWKKKKKQFIKIQNKITNSRKDFFHKITKQIIEEYDVIVLEDLSIKEMASKERRSKTVLDVSWSIFIKQLEYKAKEKGKIIIKVNKFFPSSQICSECGEKNKLNLSNRIYNCSNCGIKLDRDLNAAINLKNEGRRIVVGEQ